MAKAIDLIKPKVFVAENVSAMKSMDGVIEQIQKDFSSVGNGYFVLTKELKGPESWDPTAAQQDCLSRDIKISSNRRGVKVISIGCSGSVPPPTHTTTGDDRSLLPVVEALTHLNDLQEPHQTQDLSQQKYSKAQWLSKGQGQTEIRIGQPAPTIRAEHHGNIEFRRLSSEDGGTHTKELRQNSRNEG